MTCTNCGEPCVLFLCDACQRQADVRLEWEHESVPFREAEKARRNKRRRQLRQLKKIKQRTLEFE